jgi:uncharacterized protein (DUF983 family)
MKIPDPSLAFPCPVCWKGAMFTAPWRMNDHCPHCNYKFDKGNGYFVGAMYSSYTLSLALAMGLAVGLFLAGLPTWANLTVIGVVLCVVGPLVIFPYSRVLWVWAERNGWLHDGEEDVARLRREHALRTGAEPKRELPEEQQSQVAQEKTE